VNHDSDQIRRALEKGSSTETVLVAAQSDTIVGFACFQTLHSVCYDSPWTEITELYVTPSHRRCGVGKALVGEAICQAERRGDTEILLRTNVKNEAAKSLFTQMRLERAPDTVFRKSIGPA
jgi:GNAT superfamily N-acetyltransferase